MDAEPHDVAGTVCVPHAAVGIVPSSYSPNADVNPP
jgi:hypothetical protein